MSYKEDFSRLETLVEKLLAQVDALRRQNGELQAALESKGMELDKMQNETGNLQEERGEILNRVNRLISSIEQWEGGQQVAGEDNEDPTAMRMAGD